MQARDFEADASFRLGYAEAPLGRLASAVQEIRSGVRFDASTGMARVGLAQRDVGATLLALRSRLQLARANVEGDVFNEAAMASELVGADAAVGDFDGVEYPRLIELTIHRVFAVAGDPRAAAWLQRAHCKLMAQADAITDAALRCARCS